MTLKEALDSAVKREDYERAAVLRDKIKKHGEGAMFPTMASKPVKLQTRMPDTSAWPPNTRPVHPAVWKRPAGASRSEPAKKTQPSKRRTRPVRELMAERRAAVQEELGARLAAIQDMSGEKVYRWDVIRIADMRNYYEEFILDGVCILRVQHFDERFYL